MVFSIINHMATKGLQTCLGSGYKQTVDILWEVDKSRQIGLLAQVTFDRDNQLPESGDDLAIKETRIALIKTQLNHEILPGVKLSITYPISRTDPLITETSVITVDKSMIDGGTIGYVVIFPKRTSQS